VAAPSAGASPGVAGTRARQASGLRPRRATLSAMDAQAGFALMEVLISAVIVALIVIATFSGFDIANQASASERQRAQADTLAQQDEDRLRSFQIDQLSGLSETHTVVFKETTYTVQSKGEFISDDTGGTSCSTEAQEASYVRTTSTVTWAGSGTRDPVVETGLITPPAGGQLLVQVIDAKGNPLSGVTATATGPSAATAVTGPQGCVIFAGLNEGEYVVKVHRSGYVSKEGVSEPEQTGTIVAGATEKKVFELDQAGAIAVSFETTSGAEAKSDTFVAQNSLLPTPFYKTFGTVGTYETTVTSGMELLPFGEPATSEHPASGRYQVYAGTCEADSPAPFGVTPVLVNVLGGETVSVNVHLPAINIRVMSGSSSSSPGSAVTSFSGKFDDEGCKNIEYPKGTPDPKGPEHPFSTTTATNGELHKGMPFGKAFLLCVASNEKVTVGASSKYRKIEGISIANESVLGTALQTIYLSGSGSESNSFTRLTC
jgi:Tfp pilus assembly protein PilV